VVVVVVMALALMRVEVAVMLAAALPAVVVGAVRCCRRLRGNVRRADKYRLAAHPKPETLVPSMEPTDLSDP
jgi:hypothetical protein